jgi:hypothetical protein
MTLFHCLALECGPGSDDALGVARQLGEAALEPRLEGTVHRVTDTEGNTWCSFVPAGLPAPGRGLGPAELAAVRAAADRLHARLRKVSGYRFGLFGAEVEGIRTFTEIVSGDHDLPGLVVAEAVWEEAGRPPGFGPFARGYRWRPPPPGFDYFSVP